MTRGNVLLCGADGQLGQALQRTCPSSLNLLACGRDTLDITCSSAVVEFIARHDVTKVINAAAYTAVDKAETEQNLAHAVNAEAPGFLARACAAYGARLLHVSTDFVFDGQQGTPYQPEDTPNPLGYYGQTKWLGEQAVLAAGADALVLRTGWVYGSHGSNFVKTMLRLMTERDRLGVVDDQIGTPTWARGLAETCWDLLLEPNAHGIFHWSDAGACSWYDFAVAVQMLGSELGLLQDPARIEPIPSSAYPTPACRPPFSVLDKQRTRACIGRQGTHWYTQLRLMLTELTTSED